MGWECGVALERWERGGEVGCEIGIASERKGREGGWVGGEGRIVGVCHSSRKMGEGRRGGVGVWHSSRGAGEGRIGGVGVWHSSREVGRGEERWVGGCVSSREVGRGEERWWEGVLAPERWGEGRRGGVGVWHSF